MNKCPKCNRNMLKDESTGKEYCVKCEPKEAEKVYEEQVNVRADQEAVAHPPHYLVGGIETVDIIEAKLSKEEFKGWLKGNVIKYVLRAGHKNNELEDLKKARWFLDRLITVLE